MNDSENAGADGATASSSSHDSETQAVKEVSQLGTRARRTRAALIDAAREVFEADGLKEARVADITSRAGVAYGSFYNYFTSKEEVFREVVREVTGEMFTQTVARGLDGADAISRIREANTRYLRSYARNARIMALIEEVAPYDDYCAELLAAIRSMFNQRNEAGIRRLQARGLVRTDGLDAHIAAVALGGMIEHYARVSFIMGEPYEEGGVIETLTTLWAQALGLRMEQTTDPRPAHEASGGEGTVVARS